ncbi:BTAD domain-containing putative transcriptional regulator [Crossiella sp. CA198]|uniref:BTAD domain-containing putative transcriptional regulator n=1 Tax=Crossiella sp. CA198 TaxID=3455607 RepID=UPI003F8D58D9
MDFRLLGPVELREADRPVELGPVKQRCVLAALLWNAGRPTAVDTLIDWVWDERPPPRARQSLYSYLARLRGILGGTPITYTPAGYRLDVPPEQVDAHRFRELIARAQSARGERSRQAGLLRTALDLWRGPPLSGLSGERVERVRAGLEQARVSATIAWAEAALTEGEFAAVVREVADLLAAHPLNESLIGAQMRALAGAGRAAEALACFAAARERFAEELGAEPGPALRTLHEALLRGSATPVAPAAPPRARWRGPRPLPNRLIGRERAQAGLAGLIAPGRLVTVIGTGGCGKTTLALHTAREFAPRFRDGVAVLLLESLSSAKEVTGALGALFEVRADLSAEPLEAVAAALAGQRCLLLADNCEHLGPATATLLGHLLGACPGLAVLATSRQPLGLPGESVWRLDPLPVPAADAPVTLDQPAVALFLERARQAEQSFTVSTVDWPHLVEICRRLDGLPLALELAATRVRAFGLSELAGQLRDRLDLLFATGAAGHRHQALSATIDWSYRLLTGPEQRVLARLSVLPGGFSLAAAEAVCGAEPLCGNEVAAAVAALVDRSLVAPVDTPGGRRFRLLATLRVFAADRLAEFGEVSATEERQLAYWLARARRIDAIPRYGNQFAALSELAPDLPNLRHALAHGYASGHEQAAAELTARIFEFFLTHTGYPVEGQFWSRRALACQGLADHPEVHALLRFQHAALLGLAGDFLGSLTALRAVLGALAETRPREHLEAMAGLLSARCALLDPAGLAELPELVAAARRSTLEDVLTVFTSAGVLLNQWGRPGEAARLCAEYEQRVWAQFDRPPSTTQLALRVEVALALGEPDRALALAEDLRHRLPSWHHAAEQDAPRRSIALAYLVTGRLAEALALLTETVNALPEQHSGFTARWTYLRVLHAEALRRSGRTEAAVRALIEALHSAADSTNFRFGLPGVLATALLAADLGDTTASAAFAADWDRLRRAAGLPAPLGLRGTVAERLGLDPATPPAPDPGWTWAPEEFTTAIRAALTWWHTR